jgi:hypothetical protein
MPSRILCKGKVIPDKPNIGGRRREKLLTSGCLQAVSASFLAKPIGILQPTEKLFIYVAGGSELHLIMEAAL